MKILITGGNGFLAKNISSKISGHEIIKISRNDFDLRNSEDVKNFIRHKYFDVILHTAIVGGNRLITDSKEIVYDNTIMLTNFLSNRKNFGRFINFGSGAELDRKLNIDSLHKTVYESMPVDSYGFSKNINARLVLQTENCYNLRVFNVFSEEEHLRRMIKGNVHKYFHNEPMEIHQDKFMDFMYIEDFMKIIKLYIETNNLPKDFDCVYEKKYKLSEICEKINNIAEKKVAIKLQAENLGLSYCGKFYDLKINFSELEYGIRKVYNYICHSHSNKMIQTGLSDMYPFLSDKELI